MGQLKKQKPMQAATPATPATPARPTNYGQTRSAEVHARNAARKAARKPKGGKLRKSQGY